MHGRPFRTLALAIALASCAGGAFDRARERDSIEGWREYLSTRPGDERADFARERIAELEFQAARREHTAIAYKRFLQEFPDSPRRSDAEVLLEGIRFEAAQRAATAAGWREFLRDHPAGGRAPDARAALELAEFGEARAASGARALADFATRYPDSPRRAEAERLADDRAWQEARAAGPRGLTRYLQTSPAGGHRDEARAQLAAREALASAALGDFEGAWRQVRAGEPSAAHDELVAALSRAEVEAAAAALDPKPLEALAKHRGAPVAALAREQAAALARHRRARELKALAARLDARRFAPPVDALRAQLAAADPRDRWLAAQELAGVGELPAVDLLLESVASSRFTRVRARAFEALRALFALMPGDAREIHARRRLESLRAMAQGPALFIKLALIEELLGEDAAALEDYARARRGDAGDQFVLARLAVLRAKRGEHFSSASAARELAVTVQSLVEQRAEEKELGPLLLARTLCGARDMARAALDSLRALPADRAAEYPDDLRQFTQRAEEVARLAEARLGDAEAAARAADPRHERCDDDGGLAQRLAEGEQDRLGAIAALAGLRDRAARPALARAAQYDPSARVRTAARDALAATEGGKAP